MLTGAEAEALDPSYMPQDLVAATLVETSGDTTLELHNRASRALSLTAEATLYANQHRAEWAIDLGSLDSDQTASITIQVPRNALSEPSMLGYVARLELRIHGSGSTIPVSGYVWFREDGQREVLTEEAIYRDHDGAVPAHGPLALRPFLDLMDPEISARLIMRPPAITAVANRKIEDSGQLTTEANQ